MTNSSKIIAHAFNDDNLNEHFNMDIYDDEDDFEHPFTMFDITFCTMSHGDGLGYLNEWASHIADNLNIEEAEVRKVLLNRLMLKKLFNRLNFLEVQWKIKKNTELLKAIRRRVTTRRIAINKIKRNAIYNNGLGLKLAVVEYSKDFMLLVI